MKKRKAILFLDYHETFDDVGMGKGHVFANAYKQFAENFDSVTIVVITFASHEEQEENFRDDLAASISSLPFKQDFKFLIENGAQYFSEINVQDGTINFEKIAKFSSYQEKKCGVELMLQILAHYHKEMFDIVVTAGNSTKYDLSMINSNVYGATNYFILTRRKGSIENLNKFATVFKVYGENKQEINSNSKKIILKSANYSYGLAQGLIAIANHIKSCENTKEA